MPVRGWLDALRSYVIGMKASRRLWAAGRLRRAGRTADALDKARSGLALLSAPVVRRSNGVEATALICLTTSAEQLAQQLGVEGASTSDLSDSIQLLRRITTTGKGRAASAKDEWLPFLEARLALRQE